MQWLVNQVMSSPKEIEIKLELPPGKLPKLEALLLSRDAHRSVRSEDQISVYFDTDQLKLHKHGLTLRVRRIDGCYVQTIKKAPNGSLFERGEWESKIDGEQPDMKAARGTALQPFLDKDLQDELRPVFETRVRRSIYPLKAKDFEIMLTVDRGSVDTGESTLALHEAELELKRGERGHLFRIARLFSRATSAELAIKSKSQRGYELLDGYDAAVTKADRVMIGAEMEASDAFQLVANACLKQIVANKPAILAADTEGIHQMRIGLRRMRAAISLFADIIHENGPKNIKAELKWLTAELSPAREWDVFLTQVVTPLEDSPHPADMRRFFRELTGRRDAAIQRAKAAICSERFRNFTLNVAEWLEIGNWRTPPQMPLRERGEEPIETVVVAQLNRRWRKIRKQGRHLAELDPRKRHKLRIQTKKLRYASEFFETLFPGKKTRKRHRKFLVALRDVQDCLGGLNDISVHISLSKVIAAKTPSRAFAAGLVIGHEEAREAAVLAAAVRSLKAFSKARPYWE